MFNLTGTAVASKPSARAPGLSTIALPQVQAKIASGRAFSSIAIAGLWETGGRGDQRA